MKRIVVLGCSGSGKSTLARRLGDLLGLPAVHLDPLYWRPGWRKPEKADFRARVAAAFAGDSWISEGNYRETFDLRLPRAELVIILETPRWLCLARVLRRIVFSSRGADLPEGCPEHWDWDLMAFIWRFNKVTRPQIEEARVAHGSEAPVILLRNSREVEAFVASLRSRGQVMTP